MKTSLYYKLVLVKRKMTAGAPLGRLGHSPKPAEVDAGRKYLTPQYDGWLLENRNPDHDAFHLGGIFGIGVVEGEQLVEAFVPV